MDMPSMSLDTRTLCKMVVKYITLGLVIAIVCLILPKQKLDLEAVIALALVSAATFAILDLFAPTLSGPAQLGLGVGVGWNLSQI
jgi:hypothetical protein